MNQMVNVSGSKTKRYIVSLNKFTENQQPDGKRLWAKNQTLHRRPQQIHGKSAMQWLEQLSNITSLTKHSTWLVGTFEAARCGNPCAELQ